MQGDSYQENHTALNWRLFVWAFSFVELLALVVVLVAVFPSAGGLSVLLVPSLWLLYLGPVSLRRNWPTGIRIDERGVRIGAVGSQYAGLRSPHVDLQAWGRYEAPWSAIHDVRVVTDRAELRQLRTSENYANLTGPLLPSYTLRSVCIGVLSSPFMRAALVIDYHLDDSVQLSTLRPRPWRTRYRRGMIEGVISPSLVAPIRKPARVRAALERFRP